MWSERVRVITWAAAPVHIAPTISAQLPLTHPVKMARVSAPEPEPGVTAALDGLNGTSRSERHRRQTEQHPSLQTGSWQFVISTTSDQPSVLLWVSFRSQHQQHLAADTPMLTMAPVASEKTADPEPDGPGLPREPPSKTCAQTGTRTLGHLHTSAIAKKTCLLTIPGMTCRITRFERQGRAKCLLTSCCTAAAVDIIAPQKVTSPQRPEKP